MSAPAAPTTVLVLGGGPDAERPVSIESATGVAEACSRSERLVAKLEIIDRPSASDLQALIAMHRASCVFPVLHGRWGEGGPLQELLERCNIPYVGCQAPAARRAIDKAETKRIASLVLERHRDDPLAQIIRVSHTELLNPSIDEPPLNYPFVAKPNFEGSTFGLHIVKDPSQWPAALAAIRADPKAYIAEPLTPGREFTAGMIASPVGGAGAALIRLPLVEIAPASDLYDFAAKYQRDDTVYTVAPNLPEPVTQAMQTFAIAVAEALGIRHLARADYMYDERAGTAHFLEINTMPGFTSHSLLPKAAAHTGLPMPALCERLIEAAIADHASLSHALERGM
ncbi:MAG: D-alanine--D-alanine ligase family protein [Phycisphaerales bacterium]